MKSGQKQNKKPSPIQAVLHDFRDDDFEGRRIGPFRRVSASVDPFPSSPKA
jgi:hypothetical protein